MKTDACRSCGAPIVWVLTKDRKPMPIEPSEGGKANIRLEGLKAVIVEPGTGTHLSHFATCPQAGKWRSKK